MYVTRKEMNCSVTSFQKYSILEKFPMEVQKNMPSVVSFRIGYINKIVSHEFRGSQFPLRDFKDLILLALLQILQ